MIPHYFMTSSNSIFCFHCFDWATEFTYCVFKCYWVYHYTLLAKQTWKSHDYLMTFQLKHPLHLLVIPLLLHKSSCPVNDTTYSRVRCLCAVRTWTVHLKAASVMDSFAFGRTTISLKCFHHPLSFVCVIRDEVSKATNCETHGCWHVCCVYQLALISGQLQVYVLSTLIWILHITDTMWY